VELIQPIAKRAVVGAGRGSVFEFVTKHKGLPELNYKDLPTKVASAVTLARKNGLMTGVAEG
jgi:hypothetical protein